MSYDVYIGEDWVNFTSNCSALWYDHIPDSGKGGGLREIDGMTGAEAARLISSSFNQMNATRHSMWEANVIGEPKMSAKYDAKNGWGSLIGAILFMGQIIDMCLRNPRKKVRVSL